MSTTILSFQNRVVIKTLHNEGRSLRYIANYLDFSKTTIFNELHRLNGEYQAELAQTDFERKISQRGRKSSLTKSLKHLISLKYLIKEKMALCQILLMGHFRRRPVLAPGAAFFQLPFPFDAIGSGR